MPLFGTACLEFRAQQSCKTVARKQIDFVKRCRVPAKTAAAVPGSPLALPALQRRSNAPVSRFPEDQPGTAHFERPAQSRLKVQSHLQELKCAGCTASCNSAIKAKETDKYCVTMHMIATECFSVFVYGIGAPLLL